MRTRTPETALRRLAVTALAVTSLGMSACGGGSPSSEDRESAAAQTQTTTAPAAATNSSPTSQQGSDEERIRSVLAQEHDAFLAGDADTYCQVLTEELRRALDGCTFINDSLASQQRSGLVIEDQEILELTIEDGKAYAAVYQQQDDESPATQTPSDFELTKIGDAWQISKSRYRTEREDGPAKCFVGGSFADLC
jgi:hypothetical protein